MYKYRVERIKGRLVDRFSDELLRGFSPFPLERGEMWDVSLPPFTPLQPLRTPYSHQPPPHGQDLSSQVKTSAKEDETLKLLKKYYLEALLAQQTDFKLPYDEQNVSSVAFQTLSLSLRPK